MALIFDGAVQRHVQLRTERDAERPGEAEFAAAVQACSGR